MNERTNDPLQCLGSRGLQPSTDELYHHFGPKAARVQTLFRFLGAAGPGKVSKGGGTLVREGVYSLLAVQGQEAEAARPPRVRVMDRVKWAMVKTGL